jgi:DNA-binding protein HU-beta
MTGLAHIKKERKMTKNEFVELVKEEGGFETKAQAEKAIKGFTGAVEKVLSKKDSVTLVGFGSFTTAFQKGKTGIVPGTDREYTTEDKYVPKFKAGKGLKEIVAKS